MLTMLYHLFLITMLWVKYYHRIHFTNEETDSTLFIQHLCPSHHKSWYVWELRLKPRQTSQYETPTIQQCSSFHLLIRMLFQVWDHYHSAAWFPLHFVGKLYGAHLHCLHGSTMIFNIFIDCPAPSHSGIPFLYYQPFLHSAVVQSNHPLHIVPLLMSVYLHSWKIVHNINWSLSVRGNPHYV